MLLKSEVSKKEYCIMKTSPTKYSVCAKNTLVEWDSIDSFTFVEEAEKFKLFLETEFNKEIRV